MKRTACPSELSRASCQRFPVWSQVRRANHNSPKSLFPLHFSTRDVGVVRDVIIVLFFYIFRWIVRLAWTCVGQFVLGWASLCWGGPVCAYIDLGGQVYAWVGLGGPICAWVGHNVPWWARFMPGWV